MSGSMTRERPIWWNGTLSSLEREKTFFLISKESISDFKKLIKPPGAEERIFFSFSTKNTYIRQVFLERVAGIEPATTPWKRVIWPLNYTREISKMFIYCVACPGHRLAVRFRTASAIGHPCLVAEHFRDFANLFFESATETLYFYPFHQQSVIRSLR